MSWLPTTWFENLGAAERVSKYEVTYKLNKNSEGGLYDYFVSCKVRTPDNKIVDVSTHGEYDPPDNIISVFGHTTHGRAKSELIDQLRDQIRRAYPKGGL